MKHASALCAAVLIAGCNFRPDVKGQDYSIVDDRIPVGTSGHVRHLGPSAQIDAVLMEQSWSTEYADQRPGLRLVADQLNLVIGDHYLIGFIHPRSDQICHPSKQDWEALESALRRAR